MLLYVLLCSSICFLSKFFVVFSRVEDDTTMVDVDFGDDTVSTAITSNLGQDKGNNNNIGNIGQNGSNDPSH